jgi:hypothetical protein
MLYLHKIPAEKNKGRQRKLNGGLAQMTKSDECLFPTLELPRSGSKG